MEYIKLILGLALSVTFIWLLVKNSKRSGFISIKQGYCAIAIAGKEQMALPRGEVYTIYI